MDNQLQVIVKENGMDLNSSKAKEILTNFQNYFEIAAEWEKKAKAIKVTDASQTTDMAMARVGRLEIRAKRLAVEKKRKELKEAALREGKAIDGIANVLKGLMAPIEEYLDRQEHFVEIQKKERLEKERIEAERKAEEDRIAKEKADAEERERQRLENIRLKKEAEERERRIADERKKQDEILAKERAKAEGERRKHDEQIAKEREKADAERREQEKTAREKAEATAKKQREIEEKARKEKEEEKAKVETERKEKERLAELLKNQVTCPKCGHKFQIKER